MSGEGERGKGEKKDTENQKIADLMVGLYFLDTCFPYFDQGPDHAFGDELFHR